MGTMPPEFYVPAFTFLVTIITAMVTALKILWARYLEIADRLHSTEQTQIVESSKAIALNSEALRANTSALDKLADLVVEPPQDVKRRWQQR